MIIWPDSISLQRLQRAADATGRSIDDLATSAVEEAALSWARENGFPGEDDKIIPPHIEDRPAIDLATGLREDDLP